MERFLDGYLLMSDKQGKGGVMVRYLLAILVVVFAGGCAGHNAGQAPVETGAPVVYIHPMNGDLRQASVTVLPFNVPQGVDVKQGEKVAALFQDVLLGKQAFHTVKRVNRHYGSLDEATDLARQAGTDLVLAGKINYLLSGAALGGARVDVSVRVVDVASGNTVWYIEQTMDQRMDHPDVSVKHRLASVFSIPALRPSVGAPVVPNMLVNIAVDVAEVMAGARYVAKM